MSEMSLFLAVSLLQDTNFMLNELLRNIDWNLSYGHRYSSLKLLQRPKFCVLQLNNQINDDKFITKF